MNIAKLLSLLCVILVLHPPIAATSEEVIRPVVGLDGQNLYPPESSPETRAKQLMNLEQARHNFETNPTDLDNIIWLGRRTAYLWRYHDAIDIYTAGLVSHPDSPELFRHRGHRFISIRQFDEAIADFARAAELAKSLTLTIEPDGVPNRLNQPLSNLHFNIYYHWALAHYLKGEFQRAAELYRECMEWSDNPDLKVATADWLYMTLMRIGSKDEAQQVIDTISPEWDLIENDGYFNRILMYKGLVAPGELLDLEQTDLDLQLNLVTQGYGVGNYYLYMGNADLAQQVFKKILTTDYWSAFGYIAAEAELQDN